MGGGGLTIKNDHFSGSINILGIFGGYCKNRSQNLLLN